MPFLSYLTKTFFSSNPFLEMIGKDDFFSLLYAKSKLAFKTTFSSLSKLEKRLKIHLHCKFKKVLLENKFVFIKFLKFLRHNCATNLAHNTDVRSLNMGMVRIKIPTGQNPENKNLIDNQISIF